MKKIVRKHMLFNDSLTNSCINVRTLILKLTSIELVFSARCVSPVVLYLPLVRVLSLPFFVPFVFFHPIFQSRLSLAPNSLPFSLHSSAGSNG